MERKILIINGKESILQGIKRNFFRAGFESLVLTSSLSEGIKKAETEKPDLVIIDISLPDLAGFEACREIRRVLKGSAKIIAITNSVDANDAAKAREAGADDYVVKTKNESAVINAVRKLDSVKDERDNQNA